MEVGDERLTLVSFPFLAPTNKTGMSKQKNFHFDFHTKAYKATENTCLDGFKPSSFEPLSQSTEMLSEIKVHALPLMQDVYFFLTHVFFIFSSNPSLILMFVQVVSFGVK